MNRGKFFVLSSAAVMSLALSGYTQAPFPPDDQFNPDIPADDNSFGDDFQRRDDLGEPRNGEWTSDDDVTGFEHGYGPDVLPNHGPGNWENPGAYAPGRGGFFPGGQPWRRFPGRTPGTYMTFHSGNQCEPYSTAITLVLSGFLQNDLQKCATTDPRVRIYSVSVQGVCYSVFDLGARKTGWDRVCPKAAEFVAARVAR